MKKKRKSSEDQRESDDDRLERKRRSTSSKEVDLPKTKKRKKSHGRSTSEDSSSTTDRKSRKKKKKEKKKHTKKERRDSEERIKKLKRKLEKLKEKSVEIGPTVAPPSGDLQKQTIRESMRPMTKEEWEKKQRETRYEVDEETGRKRLVRGNGEILEEIVSKEKQREINKQATAADGMYFLKQTMKK